MSSPRRPIRGYLDLEVWQRAMDLVVQCYRVTRSFPANERYGLTAQARRAAVSVPSNIAEGRGRRGLGDFLRHLAIANGSLTELETQLQISVRLGYIAEDDARAILRTCGEVGRLLAGLGPALRRRRASPGTPVPVPARRFPRARTQPLL